MADLELVAHKCITSLARRYVSKLPDNSVYEYEDLVQEGWLMYWKIVSSPKSRNPWDADTFPGLLKTSVERKFIKILRYHSWPCRTSVIIDNEAVDAAVTSYNTSPERIAMLMQAIAALREVNWPVAYYLIFGGHTGDFGFMRYLQRQRKHGRWTTDGMRFRWTPELVKLIFDFDPTSFPLCGYI